MRPQLDGYLRRAYPTGDLYELRVGELNRYCQGEADCLVLGRLRSLPGAVVDVLPLDLEWTRSNEVCIGLPNAASWLQFNRAMSERERGRELVRLGGSLTYWAIQVSRVAPVWYGGWNEFRRRKGVVKPEEVPEPAGWLMITQAVRTLLRSARYHELNSEMVNQRVPWMTGCTVTNSDRNDDRPSLYECLFLEY